MKKLLAAVVGLCILAGVAQAGSPAPWVNTGDRSFDATLQKMDDEAKADRDGFLKQISSRYGIPERDIRDAQDANDLSAADIFMATAVSKAANRPVRDVAGEYARNKGKGWGVMAMEMGIKPGSKEFHALKQGAQGSVGQMKAKRQERERHEAQVRKDHERKAKHEAKLAKEHERQAKQEAEQAREQERKAKQEAKGQGHGKSR